MIRKIIQITEEQNEALRKIAYDERLTFAELIRRAITAYLKREGK